MEIPKSRFNHTKQRLNERFKIDMSEKDYIDLCKLSKDSYKSRDYSKNRDTRIVEFKNKTISVGFNHKLGLVNTVMHPRRRELKYYKIYKEIFN